MENRAVRRPAFQLVLSLPLVPLWGIVLLSCVSTSYKSNDPHDINYFCRKQGWQNVCGVPEYTDDQRLDRGDNVYGPWAHFIPAGGLGNRDLVSFATVGEAVGAVLVDTSSAATLPQNYRNIGLVAGWTCVYLRFDGTAFSAYLKPAQWSSGSRPCKKLDSPPSETTTLQVVSVSSLPFTGNGTVPAVARFHEGRGISAEKVQPLLGMKCYDKWCVVVPAGASLKPLPHKGLHPTERKWEVNGWSDAQRLGKQATPTSNVELSSMVASIVAGPGTNYQTLEAYPDTAVLAATVYFPEKPAGDKYIKRWGFTQGENQLWIRLKDGAWTGKVKNPGPCGSGECWHTVRINRTSHKGAFVPATARFRWDENDEDVWVRCADGCCQVSGS